MLCTSDVFVPMPPGQRTHFRGRGRRGLSMACIVVAVLGMIANVTSGPSPESGVLRGVPGPGSGSPDSSIGQLWERLRGGKNRSRQEADCSAPCVGVSARSLSASLKLKSNSIPVERPGQLASRHTSPCKQGSSCTSSGTAEDATGEWAGHGMKTSPFGNACPRGDESTCVEVPGQSGASDAVEPLRSPGAPPLGAAHDASLNVTPSECSPAQDTGAESVVPERKGREDEEASGEVSSCLALASLVDSAASLVDSLPSRLLPLDFFPQGVSSRELSTKAISAVAAATAAVTQTLSSHGPPSGGNLHGNERRHALRQGHPHSRQVGQGSAARVKQVSREKKAEANNLGQHPRVKQGSRHGGHAVLAAPKPQPKASKRAAATGGKGLAAAGAGAHDIRSGDIVCGLGAEGGFIVHERLGSGGFGTVYQATDVRDRREVALKIQRPGNKLCQCTESAGHAEAKNAGLDSVFLVPTNECHTLTRNLDPAQVALDEVALLKHVKAERQRLLRTVPPGASAGRVADKAVHHYHAAASSPATRATAGAAGDGASPVEEAVDADAVAAAAAVAGSECVVDFYGHGVHKSRGGPRICIQMEALGPSLLDLIRQTRYAGVDLALAKSIARDGLRALHFLHTVCGIVHTDIKPENLLLCVGQPSSSSALSAESVGVGDSDSLQMAADVGGMCGVGGREEEQEELERVRRIVHSGAGSWYQVLLLFVRQLRQREKLLASSSGEGSGGSAQLHTGLQGDFEGRTVRTEIVDLGNSCFEGKPFTEEIQTIEYRSPEVILRAGYCGKADIWSLACTIFELVTGEYLFDPKECKSGGRVMYEREEDLLAHHQELLGPVPASLLRRGAKTRHFFTEAGSLQHITDLKPWPLDEVLIDKYGMEVSAAHALADFLLPMLRLDPNQRASAAEMLVHPWLES